NGVANGVALGDGTFSISVTLNTDVANTLTVSATDGPGNTGTNTVVITHATPTPPAPPVVSSGGGGGGGGGLRMDSCSEGDYSPSYYDGKCGTKPVSGTTTTVPPVSTHSPAPVVTVTPTYTPTSIVVPTSTKKKNVTYVSSIEKVISANPSLSQEKMEILIDRVRAGVFARTTKVSERIMTLSSIVRYLTVQVDNATSEDKKVIYTTLRNGFNTIISSLRIEMRTGVAVFKNTKKNNTSNRVTVLDGLVYRYVNTDNILAVRSEPNFGSDTTGYLLMDQRVEVLGAGPNWSHIKAGTVDGYVRTRLLRKTVDVQNSSALLTYRAVSTDGRDRQEGDREE
ncbi:MAG: SH3 domain-containing protein, partial [Candidatus Gracilibacteria bacterium]|nr:SH3 domain-containing protein [Candidatus Gracilibacteria bacterium]